MGPNGWHKDGDLAGLLKIMLYSSPTGTRYGGIELMVDGFTFGGPPGQWICFYNSQVKHRGRAPTFVSVIRVATEITICPSKTFDLEPRFLGHVGRRPLNP